MRLLLVALLTCAPAAATAASSPDRTHKPFAKPANCPQTANHYAWQRGKAMKPHKLTELPDANVYAAVYRHIRGCEVPVVVQYGISNR